jgi:hypothetical protein
MTCRALEHISALGITTRFMSSPFRLVSSRRTFEGEPLVALKHEDIDQKKKKCNNYLIFIPYFELKLIVQLSISYKFCDHRTVPVLLASLFLTASMMRRLPTRRMVLSQHSKNLANINNKKYVLDA